MEFGGATHPGSCRDNNEDAFGVDPTSTVAVVADGVGGLDAGELASRAVVDATMLAAARGQSLAEAVRGSHQQLLATDASGRTSKMASTLVAIQFADGRCAVHWVGDSRCYRLRDGQLTCLTQDHSFAQAMVEAGALSLEEAARHPHRGTLTRAVGVSTSAELKVDTVTAEVLSGDRYLLCSDGLHAYLAETTIRDTLHKANTAQQAADGLIARTLQDTEAGDNVTVVCAWVDDP